MDASLVEFVDHARERGLDHASIRHLLVSAGWSQSEIAEVFCSRELALPIPKPTRAAAKRTEGNRPQGSLWPRRARDALLNLLTFGALVTSATTLILLFFTYLDFALPDPAWRVSYARLQEALSIIRVQLAILIVMFPTFLALWHFLLREVRLQPEKGAMRRWLGYLCIFVGAITLSADVITLLFHLLEGQLTARFLLKAGVLFTIAGSLVWYLASTLRGEAEREAAA
ncbi:MAG: DUF5671 domain-containing protein [Pirellulaceae bacterium]|nr:DUF5671 domain-containing protein [Pirellulaceae bacterium]